jgi:hypothetical protein
MCNEGLVKINLLVLIDFLTLHVSIGPDAFPNETIIPLTFKHSIEPSNVFLPTPS